jgi:hypothetical protein
MSNVNLVARLIEIGLKGAHYANGRVVCWTTDRNKMEAARDAGAEIREHKSTDPRFSGWEVIA